MVRVSPYINRCNQLVRSIFFLLTYRLLITSDRRGYTVSIAQIAVSGAVKPIFGNIIATQDEKYVNERFDYYELGMNVITTIFSCCIVLVVPFIMQYTKGITDADYSQPIAILMCIAEATYCYRDSFVAAAYSVGHFKQTAKYAYIEAAINITVSLSLVFALGLVGVAIGTLSAMIYRMIMQVVYVKKNIVYRRFSYRRVLGRFENA